MSPKIAFIRMGSYSYINAPLMETLARAYPEYQVVPIELEKELIRKKSLPALAWALLTYGPDLLCGKKDWREELHAREILTRTSYFFRRVKARAMQRLQREDFAFSFQTQSLYDASLPGLPHFVYTDHTHLANLRYPDFDRRKLYSPAWIRLESSVYANAAAVLTTSNFARQSVIEDYGCPPEKVFCVYSGVQVSAHPSLEQKQYSGKHILFVGKEWERKGGPDLAAAFELVLQAHPDARLTIVGHPPNLRHPRIRELGIVPLAELERHYQEAAVFCMPSRVEPSAQVFAEACAYGLPVVSTNIGGTPDRVLDGRTGFLVAPGDVAGLARALSCLLDDPGLCAAFGRAGQQLSLDRFRWERVGERMRQAMDQISSLPR
jgi:glycosyltransferase involved in cell wall biosynthesis